MVRSTEAQRHNWSEDHTYIKQQSLDSDPLVGLQKLCALKEDFSVFLFPCKSSPKISGRS